MIKATRLSSGLAHICTSISPPLVGSRWEFWCSPLWCRGGEPAFIAPPTSQMRILELHFTVLVSRVCGTICGLNESTFFHFNCNTTRFPFHMLFKRMQWRQVRVLSVIWTHHVGCWATLSCSVWPGEGVSVQIRDKHYKLSHSEFHTPTGMARQQQQPAVSCWVFCKRNISHCCYVKNL